MNDHATSNRLSLAQLVRQVEHRSPEAFNQLLCGDLVDIDAAHAQRRYSLARWAVPALYLLVVGAFFLWWVESAPRNLGGYGVLVLVVLGVAFIAHGVLLNLAELTESPSADVCEFMHEAAAVSVHFERWLSDRQKAGLTAGHYKGLYLRLKALL